MLFFSSRSRHTRCALVTGVQTCVLPIFGPLLPQYRRIRAATLIRILTAEPHWCDDRQTPTEETCRDLVAGSLSEALAETTRKLGPDIARWRWGEAHQAVLDRKSTRLNSSH